MIDLHLFIDHTLLRADATKSQIDVLCREAIEFDLAAVCVSPYYVHRAYEMLKESRVKVCTVVGFPLGFSTTAIKVEEARKAIDDAPAPKPEPVRVGPKIGRNDLCPCGSGKKYKKCHGIDEE